MFYEGVQQNSALKGNNANMILSEMSTPIKRRLCIPSHFLMEIFRLNSNPAHRYVSRVTSSRRYSAGGTTDGYSRVSTNTELVSRHSRASLQAEELQSSAALCIPSHFLMEIFRLNSNQAHRYVSRVTFWRRYSAGGTTDGYSWVTANTELSRHSRASLQAEGVAPAKPRWLLVQVDVNRSP